MGFNIWTDCPRVPITQLLKFIVDNRGKTVPTAQSGHKLIATNCVTNNTLFPVYEKIRYLSDETYRTWFRAHPLPGDILFVNKGTPGRVCMVPDPVDFCIAQDMIALRADDSKIYNKYLFAVLRSHEIQQQIYNTSVGDVIPHFKKQFMDQLLIPVPDRKIQEAIGDLCYALSYKVEHNKKINDNLLQQLRAIFMERFTNNPALESIQQVPLSELCSVVTKGTTPTTLGKPFVDRGINFLKAESILDNHSLDKGKFAHIDEETHDMLKRSVIYAGDIVFTIAGTLGRFALIDSDILPANTNQAVAIIRADKGRISPEYLYACFIGNWHNDYYSKRVQQAVQANLSLTTIKSLPIPVLTQDEMVSYMALISPIIRMLKQNEMENEQLAALRDTLLPRLMSGEVDVSNIDI